MIVRDLGLVPYGEAEVLQLERLAEVAAGAEETLFLLEHPKVVTVGRHGGDEHLHVSASALAGLGVGYVRSARGGKITCHFPGQLVAYPIVRLNRRPGGVRRFVTLLEDTAIGLLAGYGITARRFDDRPGVWTERGKIASVGIAVRRWTTWHGLSLNVAADTSLFELITLCGLSGVRPASMEGELGRRVDMDEVRHDFGERFVRGFAQTLAHPALAQD
ncbi:lipoyl(octanoyl) transferase LipB [Desulfocurvibacter africanus]|uniref:Octanoyltransferase n=2 Tax=Desulfocurvibacter africanus TaxID=873 RepID=F3Z3Y8_DESAF|nr:lipoyl(octanoyl) transferase LipB [Desulfocurvibacter africanus]EGJ50440.1 Octanoyltransferase [Desulfocurvibacter africanus subsp. africanus str. Walvis Bay]